MKYIQIILSVVVLLASCAQQVPNNDEPQTLEESVLAIHDSVATPEQLALRKLLMDVTFSQVIIKNDEFILEADTTFFIANKIPLCYIKFLQESFDKSNDDHVKFKLRYKDEEFDFDINEMYQRSKKEYWEQRRKEQEEHQPTN